MKRKTFSTNRHKSPKGYPFCGLEIGPQQQKCHYCPHQYMDQIDKSVKLGKLLVDKKLL